MILCETILPTEGEKESRTMHTDKEHLQWIHDRLVQVHSVDEREDWMWKLREIIERQGWQPIETVPKDQWVLILWESNVYQARFDSEWQWWSVVGAVDADPYSIEPTHWIERPEDPKQIQIP